MSYSTYTHDTNSPLEPEYVHNIVIQVCVPNQGESVSPDMSAYVVALHFDSFEALNQFLQHPQREEMENSIQHFSANSNDVAFTIQQERERDAPENKNFYPDSGPESFNEGTILDFETIYSEYAHILNATYEANILSANVLEKGFSINPLMCADNQSLPENIAQLQSPRP